MEYTQIMNRFADIDLSFKRLPPVYGYHGQKLVPLEIALEPIQPEINELRRYIKVAKKYCHFPSEHGLTHDESASVYIYTMEWGDDTLYRLLNEALRSENRQALKIWFPYLKLFDTALDKLPTVTTNFHTSLNIKIFLMLIKNNLQASFQLSFRHIPQTVSDLNNNLTLIDDILNEHFSSARRKSISSWIVNRLEGRYS